MKDGFGTCRHCGYKAYIPATRKSMMCPICKMHGRRIMIFKLSDVYA